MGSEMCIRDSLLQTLFRCRPTVPKLSRWFQVPSCVDFFLGGMSLGNILHWTVRDALIAPSMKGDGLTSAESLQDIMAKIDPAAIEEAVGGYGALNGVRLHKAFSMLGAPRTVGSLWILAICLGGVRFFAKYLRASGRSSRIKQHRATGVKPRPPVLDLIHEEWSPVVVVLQFLSSVIANGPGGFGQGPLTVSYTHLTLPTKRIV